MHLQLQGNMYVRCKEARCLSVYFLIDILLCYAESVERVEIWIVDFYSPRDVFYPKTFVV